VFHVPCWHPGLLRGLLGVRWLLSAAICAQVLIAPAEVAAAEGPPSTEWPAAAQRTLQDLVSLAGSLVERAASGRAAASQYRIDSVYFRETLRDLMLASRRRSQPEQLAPAYLSDMVRMAALLDAAAECQSGRYIVCPADLIERLRRQHARIAQGPEGVGGKG